MVVPSFIWIPSWQTQEQSEPRTRLADLASAISMGSDGSNTDLKNWNVVLENRLHDEALAIDSFLALRGGVEPFEWNNPRSLNRLYVCEQWDSVLNAKAAGSDDVANRIWTITASFREVTEASSGGGGNEQLAPCVAVIDETYIGPLVPSPGNVQRSADIQSDWNAFRAAWPDRPFYTLVPVLSTREPPYDSIDAVYSPTGYDGVKAVVNRDEGNAANASDWFEICDFGSLPAGQQVFLFIDDSGSMFTTTVAASSTLFLSKCAAAGLPVYSVAEPDERYVQPFIAALVPT